MQSILIKLPSVPTKLPAVRRTWNPFALKTFAAASVAAGLTLTTSAATVGSGNVKSETRTVSGFHAVELSGSGNVTITQGDTEGLTVEAEDNILPLVRSEVDGKGVLHLGFKSGESVQMTKPLLFKLSAKALDNLVVAGSGTIRAKSLATTDKGPLSIVLPGSGDVTVDKLTAGALKLTLAGSGDVTLGGEATSQDVTLAGSGDYDAGSLKTSAATVKVNGSGEAEVYATETLTAEVNGSGDVTYHGQPKVQKTVHGSGSVSAADKQG